MNAPRDIDSINHVGMAVRDLAAAARCFEAMGFMRRGRFACSCNSRARRV